MRFDYLVEKVKNNISEETTSSAIAYLPGGFTTMKDYLKSLSLLKTKWNIQVLEEKENYRVLFEDELEVVVPVSSWTEFAKEVLGLEELPKSSSFEIDLSRYLTEAKEDMFFELYKKLDETFKSFLNSDLIYRSKRLISDWINSFKFNKFLTPDDVAIRYEKTEFDTRRFIERIKQEYQDDKGQLELLIGSLKRLEPLTGFDVFGKYNFLYGSVISSQYSSVNLLLEVKVDLAFNTMQRITVFDNDDVLDELSSYRIIRVVGEEIYPVGEFFRPNMVKILVDTIDSVEERK